MEQQFEAQECDIITDKTISEQDHLFKIIIIGNTGVGKSCLLKRVMDNEFRNEHNVTIGVDFGFFIVRINGKVVKLQIWDTAGQEQFRSITRVFYKGAHCVILTYDITRESTFHDLGDWLREVKQLADPDIVQFLIGNQADLEEERQVTKEMAEEYKNENKIDWYFETSAKTGQNVEKVFLLAAKHLFSIHKKDNEEGVKRDSQLMLDAIKIDDKTKRKNGKCGC